MIKFEIAKDRKSFESGKPEKKKFIFNFPGWMFNLLQGRFFIRLKIKIM